MRKAAMWLIVPLGLLGACGRADKPQVDDALKNDLSLAAQAQPYQPQQFTSPTEQGYGAAPGYGVPQRYQAVERAPYSTPAPQRTVYRASRASRSAGVYYPSAPRAPVRHTQRDATIGAAAGAILGATTSRDRVKGGLIGAAAGAVLGGIIGHTVDVDHRP